MKYLNIELIGLDKKGETKTFKLSNFKGKTLIVYFYPQDDTPVCTKEANDFKKEIENIEKHATLIGVSPSNIQDHIEFQNKYNLNFILLSDPENKLKLAFEEHNKYTKNLHRATFILNSKGDIIKYWSKVDIDGHINEILDYLNQTNL